MTVKEIFETMDYGAAPESTAEAMAWLDANERQFGHFINGSFGAPGASFQSRNPASGEVLASVTQATQADVHLAVTAARDAQGAWAAQGGPGRARHLYALARLLQKHARLFAVLESLDNGKPIRETRDLDIPLAQRHFYYHAGMAQLMEDALPGAKPLGVCGQIIPWNFPLLMLSWKIAPALAMGNTVVLKPAEYTPLTALLFADICRQAGLPNGVVNIVTGDGEVGEMIVAADVDKIAFTGSTSVGRRIRENTAGSGKGLTLELGGKSPYIVFDDADIDSAIEGLVDAIWFNQGQVCCAGSRLLVQESIAETFYTRLCARMDKLRIGNPLDKCVDVGAVVDPRQLDRIIELVGSCTTGDRHVAKTAMPQSGCFYPPTLITGLSPSDPLMQEEIFGPVLVGCTFRTPTEAVELANNTRYGLAATVWSENINLALDIAPKLAAGVIWINGTNMFDAAAPFGGVRESGFGREGGWDGLRAYTSDKKTSKPVDRIAPESPPSGETEGIDRTAKMYIDGKQTRPDSGYAMEIRNPSGELIGHVGQGSRKDVRNAVEAAQSAKGWRKTTGHLRAQILYYTAENLSARAAEFAGRIDSMLGGNSGRSEVDACLQRLFSAAAWADKYDGRVMGVPIRGVAMAMHEPVGAIGAFCAAEAPLLGLVSLMAPAIAMGNSVVLVASELHPLAATDFYQILDTSDVPPGVVNILTGRHADLAPTLAAHLNLDAVWSFSSTDLSADIERASAGNLKRTWVTNRRAVDWFADQTQRILDQATETKTVWVPYGE